MKWFAVETRLISHPKMRRALAQNQGALEMWIAMRSYVAEHETDGTVADACIDSLGGAPKSPRRALLALVDHGLIERMPTGSWCFHDFEDHAKEIHSVRAKREAERAKKAKQRAKKRGHDAGVPAPVPDAVPPPVPGGHPGGTSGKHSALELEGEEERSATADLGGQRRRPTTYEGVVALPLEERSRYAQENPHDAEWLMPQKWPEVRFVAGAFAEALGQPNFIGNHSDKGVKAIVALFAAGLTVEQCERAAEAAKSDPFFRDGSRGISTFTLEVARRLLKDGTKTQQAAIVWAG